MFKWIKKRRVLLLCQKRVITRASFQARQGNFDGKTNQWRLQLMDPPMIIGNAQVTQSSAAARAYASSILHSQLMKHVQGRMKLIHVLQFLPSFRSNKTTAGSQLKPWFDATTAHNAMMPMAGQGATAMDFEQVVENRLEPLPHYKTCRQSPRKHAKIYSDAVNHMGMRSLHDLPPVEQNHEEYLITDGMTFSQVDYRRAPEDLLQLLDRASNDVLFQYSVRFVVKSVNNNCYFTNNAACCSSAAGIGKNINSERLASSNRLS